MPKDKQTVLKKPYWDSRHYRNHIRTGSWAGMREKDTNNF